MTDVPNYLDGLRHVNQLLRSMESDFLAVLAAHQRTEVELVTHEKGRISDPSHARLAHPRRSIRRRRKTNANSKPPSDRSREHRGRWSSPMRVWWWWWCGPLLW
jgi:hypothetical protein